MLSTIQLEDDKTATKVHKGGVLGGCQPSHHSFYSIKTKVRPHPYEEHPYEEKDEIEQYPKGFLNVGNTCYANATLQCLLSTALADALLDPKTLPLFRQYSSNPNILAMGSGSVDSEDGLSAGTSKNEEGSICPGGNEQSFEGLHDDCEWLMEELTNITEDYLGRDQFVRPAPGWSWYQSDPIEKSVVNPGNITRYPDRLSSCLRPYKQEDAHEFLRGLLSTLMKQGKNKQLSSLFDGLLESAVTCVNCGKVSMMRDRYMDLSLDINDPDIRTLEEALLDYTSSEVLSGENSVYCRKCKSKQTATKGLRLATAPSILVCHLKQFACDSDGRLARLHKKIHFPMQLEIGDYMSHLNNARPPTYGLRGILVHRGQTCASGHYVAFVLRKGEWFECNDSVVTKVDDEAVLSQRAYILIYEVAEMREQPRSSPRGSRADSISTSPSTVRATTDDNSETRSSEKPRIKNDNKLVQLFLAAERQLSTCMANMACGPCAMKEPEGIRLTKAQCNAFLYPREDYDDLIFISTPLSAKSATVRKAPSNVVEVKCTASKGSPPAVGSEQRRHSFSDIEPEILEMEEDPSPEPGIRPLQSMRRTKSVMGLVTLEMHGDKGTILRHSYASPPPTNPSGAIRSSMALLDSTQSSGGVSKAARRSKLQPKRAPLAAISGNARELPPLPKQISRSSFRKNKEHIICQ
jgi:hypothetical protein